MFPIFTDTTTWNKTDAAISWLIVAVILSVATASTNAQAREADPAAIELIRSLSLRESNDPVRNHPLWAKPQKVAVSFRPIPGLSAEEFLAGIRSVAGDAEIVLLDATEPDLQSISDADVLLSFCRPMLVNAMDALRWHHSYSVGVDRCLADPRIRERDFILTNNQRVSAPSISEAAIAMTMMLSKDIHHFQKAQYQQEWARSGARPTSDIWGKTMLVLGLGGIGTETARRASGLGMRVIATRNSSREGPDFVEKIGLSDEMYELAGEADYVVNALPLTDQTNGMIGRKFFDALRPGAIYISVGRGKTTVTDDLVAALNDGRLGGAGLDVMDPEPLPSEHPLWRAKNVVITPHVSGRNIDAYRRSLIVAKENLRRYTQGERLLSVVDKERGY